MTVSLDWSQVGDMCSEIFTCSVHIVSIYETNVCLGIACVIKI